MEWPSGRDDACATATTMTGPSTVRVSIRSRACHANFSYYEDDDVLEATNFASQTVNQPTSQPVSQSTSQPDSQPAIYTSN